MGFYPQRVPALLLKRRIEKRAVVRSPYEIIAGGAKPVVVTPAGIEVIHINRTALGAIEVGSPGKAPPVGTDLQRGKLKVVMPTRLEGFIEYCHKFAARFWPPLPQPVL